MEESFKISSIIFLKFNKTIVLAGKMAQLAQLAMAIQAVYLTLVAVILILI